MSNLKKNGYARYDLMQQLDYEGIEADYQALLDYFEDLPIDEYAKDLNRYRRYSRALVLPTSGQIEWLPTLTKDGEEYSAYFQGKFNPEYPGSYREFPCIDKEIQANKLLEKIILFDYHETFWKEEDRIMPIHAGVHFVKLYVENDTDKAVSSPNCFHQDGEPFTFAHLIKRENVKGGTNAIGIPKAAGETFDTVNQDDVIEVFEITKPLESYGVEDSAVSHYVSPIEKGDAEEAGVRSVILIDYQQTVVADVDE